MSDQGAAHFPDFSFSAIAAPASHGASGGARGREMDSPVDRERFDQLVSGHLSGALRFAVRLVGDAHAAEDLVQEALYRAARGWKGFRGESAFRTWLFQIVVNVFRDQLARAEQRTGELNDQMVDGRSAEPGERASAAELGPLVARLVSALPPRQREVLVLVAYEGLGPSEAAGVLGISESNARANLAHARQRLKQQLAPYIDGGARQRK
jgi:RNA polymerase sigma-70 factor, ECF subfamily